MPTTTDRTHCFLSRTTCSARVAQVVLACLLLTALVLPSQATTLIKCRIGGKTVYSDTECTNQRTASSNAQGIAPAPKPIKIKIPKKKSGKMRAV